MRLGPWSGRTLATAAATALLVGAAGAQTAPAVGQQAPDFTAPAATRYGTLASPISLSQFRGKTVVLAFFFKARTKG